MLDPFTSLSLASAIVQLVDFSSKLLSKSKELHSFGGVRAYLDLEGIAIDLNNLNVSLLSEPSQRQRCAKPLSDDEEALRQLATRSKAVSEELNGILLDLRGQHPRQKWQSFKQAIMCVRQKDKIHALEKALDDLQRNIDSRLLKMIW